MESDIQNAVPGTNDSETDSKMKTLDSRDFQEIDLATPDVENLPTVIDTGLNKNSDLENWNINQENIDSPSSVISLEQNESQACCDNKDNPTYSNQVVRLRNHGRSFSDKPGVNGSGIILVNGGVDDGFDRPRRRSGSLLEVREQTYTRLKEELMKAQIALQLKDAECAKLSEVQIQMEKELEDLTASLFEEANRMVQDANIKRMHQEKLLAEANAKIDVLDAEVTALKALVITSTPSMPNRHLHPQIDSIKKDKSSFLKGHRRSTSHHDIKTMMEVVDIEVDNSKPTTENEMFQPEIDPIFWQEFIEWKCKPTSNESSKFLKRIIQEDIMPCLNFANTDLSVGVFETVKNNMLTIELIAGKNSFPKRCSLMETTRSCQYRIRLTDTGPWHFISLLARNRIAAVCDFYTYIRYIQQGLVKSEDNEIYWEIIRLRKEIALARLSAKT